jgi:hypothetical protein
MQDAKIEITINGQRSEDVMQGALIVVFFYLLGDESRSDEYERTWMSFFTL